MQPYESSPLKYISPTKAPAEVRLYWASKLSFDVGVLVGPVRASWWPTRVSWWPNYIAKKKKSHSSLIDAQKIDKKNKKSIRTHAHDSVHRPSAGPQLVRYNSDSEVVSHFWPGLFGFASFSSACSSLWLCTFSDASLDIRFGATPATSQIASP